MPRTHFPKYKEKYEAALQDCYAERRDHLATKKQVTLYQLLSVGAGIFALCCLAFAARVIL